jgi:hypothetical protein
MKKSNPPTFDGEHKKDDDAKTWLLGMRKWRTGGPSNTVDSGQFSTLSYAKSVFGDFIIDTSKTDTSSEGYEVAPQHDCD